MSKPKLSDDRVHFICVTVRENPDISFMDLLAFHRGHSDLTFEQAAGDIARVIEAGLIDASLLLSETGRVEFADREQPAKAAAVPGSRVQYPGSIEPPPNVAGAGNPPSQRPLL